MLCRTLCNGYKVECVSFRIIITNAWESKMSCVRDRILFFFFIHASIHLFVFIGCFFSSKDFCHWKHDEKKNQKNCMVQYGELADMTTFSFDFNNINIFKCKLCHCYCIWMTGFCFIHQMRNAKKKRINGTYGRYYCYCNQQLNSFQNFLSHFQCCDNTTSELGELIIGRESRANKN